MNEISHPDRDLGIASTQNIRDLGGYTTTDKQQTQWHRFVRSGDMDRLTQADQNKLVDYGITTVIDLRMQKERDLAPNVFSGSDNVSFIVHDFWGDRFDDYRSKRKTVSPEEKLADLYCAGLIESGFIMADIMQTIADSSNKGIAFHCRSGKDRTGLVAALLLAIAGVPSETICADFALTESFLVSANADAQIDPNQPGYYLRGCAPETMGHVLQYLANEFSGVSGYLRHQGVTDLQLTKIKNKLLN